VNSLSCLAADGVSLLLLSFLCPFTEICIFLAVLLQFFIFEFPRITSL